MIVLAFGKKCCENVRNVTFLEKNEKAFSVSEDRKVISIWNE